MTQFKLFMYCDFRIARLPIILLMSVGLLSVVQPVKAGPVEDVSDLYAFEVVVDNTSRQERSKGLIRGLDQVLVRVTGDKRISTHPAASGLLERAEQFVQQYGYVEREVLPPEPEPEQVEEGSEQPAQAEDIFAPAVEIVKEIVLRGRFESSSLVPAIRGAGLPVWDARRPKLLILTTVDAPGQAMTGADAPVSDVLRRAAGLRGLPLMIPGAKGIDPRSIWRGDRFALEDAARAAGVDYVQWAQIKQVSAGDEQTPANWVVEAALYQGGELVREWYFNAANEQQALGRLVDEVADWLASRYAVVVSSSGVSLIGLYVSGVKDLPSYARVQAILQRQGVLDKVELIAVGQNEAIYRLTARSDARQLEHALRLSRRLKPDDPGSHALRAPIWLGELELYYRLQ